MDKIIRVNHPIFLLDNYKRWGNQFYALKERNRLLNRGTIFSWYDYMGEPVNIRILPLLQDITQFHCSFCDMKDLEIGLNEPTIEHFRPSSKFPRLSYYWYNLFLCCYSCQKKGNRFNKNLLKPDRANYTFDEFFVIDWASGELIEKHQAPDIRYEQAKITIELYGLNNTSRSKARIRELNHYRNEINPVLNEFSYRFYILRA